MQISRLFFSAKIHAKEIFYHKIGYKKNHYIRQIQSPEVMIFFKICLKITCILLAYEDVISYMYIYYIGFSLILFAKNPKSCQKTGPIRH